MGNKKSEFFNNKKMRFQYNYMLKSTICTTNYENLKPRFGDRFSRLICKRTFNFIKYKTKK